jgi:hypothetical protein
LGVNVSVCIQFAIQLLSVAYVNWVFSSRVIVELNVVFLEQRANLAVNFIGQLLGGYAFLYGFDLDRCPVLI